MQTLRKLPTIAPKRPPRESTTGRHEAGAAFKRCGSTGSGKSRDRGETRTRPEASISNGVPVGSTGISRHRMARTTGAQSVGARPSRAVTASTICLQLIDDVERGQLGQPAFGFVPEPVDFRRLPNRLPHQTRGPAIAALGQRRGGQGPEEPRGAGDLARLLEPLRGGLVVVRPPVVHEPDVLHVLPSYRVVRAVPFRGARSPDPAGLGRPAGPRPGKSSQTGRRCGIADPVWSSDRAAGREARSCCRGPARMVRRVFGHRELGVAVVLDGADPVQVGGQGLISSRQIPHRLA